VTEGKKTKTSAEEHAWCKEFGEQEKGGQKSGGRSRKTHTPHRLGREVPDVGGRTPRLSGPMCKGAPGRGWRGAPDEKTAKQVFQQQTCKKKKKSHSSQATSSGDGIPQDNYRSKVKKNEPRRREDHNGTAHQQGLFAGGRKNLG